MTDGRSLRVEVSGEGTAIEWDLDALSGIGEVSEAPFSLPEDLDGERWQLARMLSAAFDDGQLLAVAALRPKDARGHGDEAVAGVLVRDGEPIALEETLLSVEYDRDGAPRRVGLEIYEAEDSLPLRIAGDRAGAANGDTTFAMRNGDTPGTGRLTVVRPG